MLNLMHFRLNGILLDSFFFWVEFVYGNRNAMLIYGFVYGPKFKMPFHYKKLPHPFIMVTHTHEIV